MPSNTPEATDSPPPLPWSAVVLGVLVLGFAWPTLCTLVRIYEHEDDYSHGFLIPIVSAWTAWKIWQSVERERLRPERAGLFFLLLGGPLVLLGQWYETALWPDGLGVGWLGGTGVLLVILGLALAFGGFLALRFFAFPLLFLAFAVPVPRALMEPFTLMLRNMVSAASEPLIRLFGITVFREGNVIHLANVSLGVEDACSGIRSLTVLLAAAVALTYWNRLPIRRGFALFCLAAPIAVVVNVLRVLVTVFLVQHFGLHFTEGWRHDGLGFLTFAAAFGLLLTAAGYLQPKASTDAPEPEPHKRRSTRPPSWTLRTAMTVSLAVIGLYAVASFAIRHRYDGGELVEVPRQAFASFPTKLAAYEVVADMELEERFSKMLLPTDYLMRQFRGPSKQKIMLRVMYWEPLREKSRSKFTGPKFHIPDACFPSWGYTRIHAYDREVEVPGLPVPITVRVYAKDGRQQMVMFFTRYRQVENIPSALAERFGMLVSSWNEPVFRYDPQFLVTLIADKGTNSSVTQARMIEFSRELAPLLPDFGVR